MNENELYHFGIKGMKWGVRRYQNTDRTRTPAGKKRYSLFASKKKSKKEPVKTSARDAYKRMNKMSDEELRKINNRIQQERQLEQYAKDERMINKGYKFAKGVLAVGGTIGGLYALSKSPASQAGIDLARKVISRER